MLIAGIQKTTLIDYPGKVAATLFLFGCNFRCSFCHNPELVGELKEKLISENEILGLLEDRKEFLDGVCITGGEPTIQKDLPDLIRKIKKIGLSIKLDSNGTNPEMLKDLINENLLDFIAMDIKTGYSKYHKLTNTKIDMERIKKSIKIIINSKIDYEFRTTVIPGFCEKEDIKEIKELIKGAKKYYLQKFIPNKTLDPKFIEKTPLTEKEMEDLKDSIKDNFEICEVR
jgi:pyruvate formate lyase activating enzyme